MDLDRLRRRFLAARIHVGKEPTKQNILKNALKMYLEGHHMGLCLAMNASIRFYNSQHGIPIDAVTTTNFRGEVFPLFNSNIAKKFGGTPCTLYWWPISDWKSRYKYMKWLIKQYK